MLNHRNCKPDTELSNEFWKIKYNKRSVKITWEILRRHQAYNTSSKGCLLCLNEKLKIALHRNNDMLHRQTKILNKCRKKSTHWYRMIAKTRVKFLFMFLQKRFTQNYCFQESGWLLFCGSSPDYWTDGFPVK